MTTTEKVNAKQLPKVFFCRHMLNGLAGYENETILVDVDDMKKMIPTFAGKPVYVFHQPVSVENIQEADGYVADCFYNELDGWLWSKFIAVSDAAHEAIAKGWAVSNAYVPKQWENGGVHQNVDYNRKIVNAEFTHLAIVPDPRYEGAMILNPEQFKEYQASKKATHAELLNNKGDKTMFKIFKNAKAEVSQIDADTMVELENGKTISVQEMVNAVKKNEDDEAAKKKAEEDEKKEKENQKLNMDMEVECGDEKMPLKELINKYMSMQKKNAEDEEKEKKNSKTPEEEAAEQAAAEKKAGDEAAAKKAEELKNAKHFEELKNAPNKVKPSKVIEISQDQLARGKNRYGSTKN